MKQASKPVLKVTAGGQHCLRSDCSYCDQCDSERLPHDDDHYGGEMSHMNVSPEMKLAFAKLTAAHTDVCQIEYRFENPAILNEFPPD